MAAGGSRRGFLGGEVQPFEVDDFEGVAGAVLGHDSGFASGPGRVEVAAGEGVGCGLGEDEFG